MTYASSCIVDLPELSLYNIGQTRGRPPRDTEILIAKAKGAPIQSSGNVSKSRGKENQETACEP